MFSNSDQGSGIAGVFVVWLCVSPVHRALINVVAAVAVNWKIFCSLNTEKNVHHEIYMKSHT